jgi:hypothetical protein
MDIFKYIAVVGGILTVIFFIIGMIKLTNENMKLLEKNNKRHHKGS